MKQKKTETEDLKLENELKKFKLAMEHGMDLTHGYRSDDMPPEVENQFLNYIEQFEKAYNSAKRTSIFDFIGKPTFREEESIPDSDLSAEIRKMMKILEKNGIGIDVIYDTNERKIYRFITEELFPYEIDDIRIKGMMTNFIYEEFHPNHEEDIRSYSKQAINCYLDKEQDFDTYHVSKELQADKQLNAFRDSFESFSIRELEIGEIVYNDKEAKAIFDLKFSGKIEGTHEKQEFSGRGILDFICEFDLWIISNVCYPVMSKKRE